MKWGRYSTRALPPSANGIDATRADPCYDNALTRQVALGYDVANRCDGIREGYVQGIVASYLVPLLKLGGHNASEESFGQHADITAAEALIRERIGWVSWARCVRICRMHRLYSGQD